MELLNDWEAIFQVLSHPERPLSHHDAERALRHWVIPASSVWALAPRWARGSSLLASVLDTCRQRG